MNKLVIRTDASEEIGFGHLTRCIALKNILLPKRTILYTTFWQSDWLNDPSIEIYLIQNNEEFVEKVVEADIVLIDGYHLTRNLTQVLHEIGASTIRIDDLAEGVFYDDLILNPNPGIPTSKYNTLLGSMLLNGAEFTLLRKSFLNSSNLKLVKDPSTLFICFGGSDPRNLTRRTLEVIEAHFREKFKEIRVVLGPGYQDKEGITHEFSASSIQFFINLSEVEIANLMAQTEFAIVPCSGILHEALVSKMITLSGYYIDNQKSMYEYYTSQNAFLDCVDFEKSSIRNALTKLDFFDSDYVYPDLTSVKNKLIKTIDLMVESQAYILRSATIEDLEVTFNWANSPITRKFSFNQSPILPDDHRTWFTGKIHAESCYYFILELDNISLGSIRFDKQEDELIISYLVAPEHHGKSLGTLILKKGLERIAKIKPAGVKTISGAVLPENKASVRIFEHFGFTSTVKNEYLIFKKEFYHV